MNRRDFFKGAGKGVLASLLGSSWLSSLSCLSPKPSSDEFPFPYDSDAFEASERIVFLNHNEAAISVIPKIGKTLEIKFYAVEDKNFLARKAPLGSYRVKDCLDIPVQNVLGAPEFFYCLEYREEGKRGWRRTPERKVRTPKAFQEYGKMEVLLISDDHTFDDGDMPQRIVMDEGLKSQRLSGDYVNLFINELKANPDFIPDETTDLGKMMSGFCLASSLNQILKNEKPDLIIFLGDTTGIGAGYKWKGLGLKDSQDNLTDQDYDDISRILWLRVRRMLSALTPNIPIYLTLGNHDGELGFDSARIFARKYRKKFFKQPGARQGCSPEENYYALIWGDPSPGESNPLFVVLDCESNLDKDWPKKPEEWKLNPEQREWFKKAVRYSSDWKFIFFHHVLGGWPTGSDEEMRDYCYGRGPLFTFEDYKEFCRDPNLVEQVELTRIMMENEVKANFYGHDHIFHVKEIPVEKGLPRKKMYGICVGSTKHKGELGWYKGDLWKKYYGSYGHFWTEPAAASEEVDFWGPAGYTKLTISKYGTRIEYKRGAYNYLQTNIPPFVDVGDVVESKIL